VIAVMTVGLWLAMSSGASAGTYDVYSCRLPGGKLVGADGWTPHTLWNGAQTSNDCATGGGLTGALRPDITVPVDAQSGWVFNAPADTMIEYYILHRTSDITRAPNDDRGRGVWLYHDAPLWDGNSPSPTAKAACLVFFGCTGQGDSRDPFAAANVYAEPAARILRLFLVAQCMGLLECLPAHSSVTIWAAQVGLSDLSAPRFTQEPSGALVDAKTVIEGERALTFAAEDRGGGIASVAFVVDGQALRQDNAQVPPATCRRPYTYAVPCPLRLERTMRLDTTGIANGSHSLQLMLTDVAGNRTLSHPVQIEVRNRGVPNGAAASQFARLDAWLKSRGTARRTTGVVPFGRTRAIAGRLATPEGAPIVGAALDVSATTGRPGSRARVIGQVVTDGNGAFSYTPKAASSRRISISYRAYTLDAAASAVSDVVLQTRAGLAVSVSPRRVGARGTIRFRGRLRGGPGRAGTQVVIYALGGARSRIPVATVRADARGRFGYRYRFSNSSPGATYRFRAILHSQRSYPYATGSSRAVTVRIR
jgi:hypothetical protein